MNWDNELNEKEKSDIFMFSLGYLEGVSEIKPKNQKEKIEKEFAIKLIEKMKEFVKKGNK
ncbi:hypothetical protein [Bacillus sp. FJAT-29937]|uniref:hypothetical protein n=1 Tax=Bacillus sp. FJAT-29937 TaxID=1720553 RepID=UPI000836E2A4|nr:hypothetical protein [Bacillus sp. FJAT-29937]